MRPIECSTSGSDYNLIYLHLSGSSLAKQQLYSDNKNDYNAFIMCLFYAYDALKAK